MDVMNLMSNGAIVGNVTQLANSNTSPANSAAFQKQLYSLVGTQQVNETNQTNANPLIASVAALLAKAEGSLQSDEITTEQLNDMLEGLLDQLEELDQLELGGEHIAVVETLLQQIEALVQVISLSSSPLTQQHSAAEFLQVNGDAPHNSAYDGVVKLQDQLLILQQALQSGSMKVLSGQSVETLVTEQLQVIQAKVAELMQDVKLKQAAVHGEAFQLAAASIASDEGATTNNEKASHLQRMNQDVLYTQAAAQVKESSPSSAATQIAVVEEGNIQQSVPIAMLRADNAKELLPHIARTGPAVSSAFVLADEFADTMKGLIVQRFNVSALNGVTEARLMLTPENLGHVDVKISMQNGLLTAMFQTETAMAKDALENQMIQLRASLAAQGITVEKIEVAQTEFASQLNQQQKQGSQGNSSNDSNASRKEHEETFEEELLINTANQELGFGRAVNETI